MLSRPRKPPSKMLLPSRSTLLTHQAKLISSLWKQRSRKSRSRLAASGCGPCCRRARPPRRGPAGSGRRTPTRRPGSGRWDAGTARTAGPRAGPWRTRASTRANDDSVERQVPGGEPGILPLVGHGHHPHRVQVPPVLVADVPPRRGRRPVGIVAVEPDVDVEEVDFACVQSSPASAWRWIIALVVGRLRGLDRRVELVGLASRRWAIRSSTSASGSARSGTSRQPEAEDDASRPAGRVEPIVNGGLGADLRRG